ETAEVSKPPEVLFVLALLEGGLGRARSAAPGRPPPTPSGRSGTGFRAPFAGGCRSSSRMGGAAGSYASSGGWARRAPYSPLTTASVPSSGGSMGGSGDGAGLLIGGRSP